MTATHWNYRKPAADDLLPNYETAYELSWLREIAARGLRGHLVTLRLWVYQRRWDAGVDPAVVAAFLDKQLAEFEDRKGGAD